MFSRIDSQPTHQFGEFGGRIGRPLPLGATLVPGGINFSVFSHHAASCTLVLFEKGAAEQFIEIPFPDEFRVGDIFTITLFGVNYEAIEYGYRMDGVYLPHVGHRFDPNVILLDPYARLIGGREIWGQSENAGRYQFRGQIPVEDYDWGADRPPQLPIEDLVIYEMHVRGFTTHPSADVRHGGTFAAIREKIPYLKALGVNCIELMPVFEFDELENDRINPETGEELFNYWGYSTVGFFAPKAGYAATGRYGMQVDEFKTLVKELHRNGIEIILDVVFNHTAEGNELGPTISFRGLDNKTYYLLSPEGKYMNFSGTGNTMNCNHPVVRNLVLDCLRYWVAEYHIDGFRFDLASILGRDQNGTPLANPPLLEQLAYDPVLAKTKLIAEAWDAGGLYQVGSFPAYGRWAEWNGKYRDAIRRFLKGDNGMTWEVAERIQGSPDLYWERGAGATVNFITSHDGFTLYDLFAYNKKHNHANGENNQDGANDNYSWNCGVEGPTDDPAVNALRHKLIKNAITILMLSRGVPMILMGDEIGHTKFGNNNTYCHDNELNWLDWSLIEANLDIFTFFQHIIAFRHAHPVLRSKSHFHFEDRVGSGYPDLSWHGLIAWQPDWGEYALTLAFLLDGYHACDGTCKDDFIYVAMNMHWEAHQFELPALPDNTNWYCAVNTGNPANSSVPPGEEVLLEDQLCLLVDSRSVIVLVGR